MRSNAVVLLVEEYNSEENEKKCKRTQTEKYINMKKNAKSEIKSGKSHLKEAKDFAKAGDKENADEQTKLAAKDLIDGTEKMFKSNAIMNGEENRKFYKTGETKKDKKRNKKKKQESVNRTHIFDILAQAPSNKNIVTKDEIKKLDKYADPKKGFNSSHTALGYGGVQPTIEEVEQIAQISDKVTNHVESEEKKVTDKKKNEVETMVDNLIDKLL